MSLPKPYIPPAEELSEPDKHDQLVDLLTRLGDALELVAGAEYFDKALGEQIKEVLSFSIKALSGITKPITEIAFDISKQNLNIIELIKNISTEKKDDSKYIELITRLNSMIEKSNEFIERGIKQVNYSDELKGIQKEIGNRPTEWVVDNIQRSRNTGRIETFTIRVNK